MESSTKMNETISGLINHGHDAHQSGEGIAIYDDNMGAYFAVSVDDAADLVDRLAAGEADAYSLWCSETDGEEVI